MSEKNKFDVIVLGGGAAGLMAAATAGQRGRSVLVIEVSNKLGKKILMSGGGRCNFTNLEVEASHFLCGNPHFVKSALNQYSNFDFIAMVDQYQIAYHQKAHGQLFCDRSSKDILAMMVAECEKGKVEFELKTQVQKVDRSLEAEDKFTLQTENGHKFCCDSLIVATGGLSIPTLGGATGFGYQLAQQFGLAVLPRTASLVPLTLSGKWQEFAEQLSGVSLPVRVSVPNKSFSESMLFTHRGLSGPAILQISNYWQLGETIELNLLPKHDMQQVLQKFKQDSPNKHLSSILQKFLPKAIAINLIAHCWPQLKEKPLQELSKAKLNEIAADLNNLPIKPAGTEGYRTAEVTKGGVCVDAISSKTLQHKQVADLYFVGEVLDVTGHLGGYNFQWAWSSGYVAGMSV